MYLLSRAYLDSVSLNSQFKGLLPP